MDGGRWRRSRHRQVWERSVAGPELVGLDAQTLEHAHVEIAQGRRVLRIEMQVLAVLEPKSGDEFLQSRPKGDGRANSWNSEPTNKGNEDSGNCSHSESAKRLT